MVFIALHWQSANRGLLGVGQKAPGVAAPGGGERDCLYPPQQGAILPLIRSDLSRSFRPWTMSSLGELLAPSYSTLLIFPNFLGKTENPEGRATPKLKVSLAGSMGHLTLHPLSKNRYFQWLKEF